MARKLYTAPIVHPIASYFKQLPQIREVPPETLEVINQSSSEIIDNIRNNLKGKNINKFFLESSYKKTSVKNINYKPFKSLCQNIGIDEIEKTESRSSYLSHVMSTYYRMLGGFFGKKISNIFKRKRDYEIAKHISKLKDGEVGLLIFGAGHQPESYINLLAPDIKIEHLTKKKDVIEEVEQIIEKIKKEINS